MVPSRQRGNLTPGTLCVPQTRSICSCMPMQSMGTINLLVHYARRAEPGSLAAGRSADDPARVSVPLLPSFPRRRESIRWRHRSCWPVALPCTLKGMVVSGGVSPVTVAALQCLRTAINHSTWPTIRSTVVSKAWGDRIDDAAATPVRADRCATGPTGNDHRGSLVDQAAFGLRRYPGGEVSGAGASRRLVACQGRSPPRRHRPCVKTPSRRAGLRTSRAGAQTFEHLHRTEVVEAGAGGIGGQQAAGNDSVDAVRGDGQDSGDLRSPRR